MSTKSRTHGIRLKIERAKEHIRNLDATIHAFIADKPYRIGARPHPIPAIEHTTLYVAEVKPVPDSIPLILGDAIHNLRSALDHLAWQLVEVGGGKPDKNTYFPICEKPHQYASMMGNGEIQKIPPDARDILEKIQPYNTVDMTLWLLHQLDIVDRHRLLLTVVTSMDKWGVDVALGRMLWFNEHRFMPLAVGYEIVNIPTTTYHRQPHENFRLGVDIAFGESEIPEGELVLYTVRKLTDIVEGTVSEFDRFLT